MNAFRTWVSVCAVVGLVAGPVIGVAISTVPVGDIGNAPDTRYETPGYGSVSYPYNIGKYEVTAGQYTEFLNKVAATDTYQLYDPGMANTEYGSGISRSGSSGSYMYSVHASFVNRPVGYVSYWDACRFANWLHNGQPTGAQGAGTTETGAYTLNGYNGTDGRTIQRNPGARWALPSEDEWYKAAYYKGGSTNAGYWDYPTRSNTAPGRDLNDVSGNNANYGAPPYPIQPPYSTTVAGQFENSESPYGTFDQGGNVWEWNQAITLQEASRAFRGLRGGSFGDDLFSLHAACRSGNDPSYGYYRFGFRVAEVPEPTTMAALALGGIGMLVRRRGLGR